MTIEEIKGKIRRINARKEGYDIPEVMPDQFFAAANISCGVHHLDDWAIEYYAQKCAEIRIANANERHHNDGR